MRLFFQKAFLLNQWLWFHILTAALAARVLPFWFSRPFTGILIFSAAILWEIIERMITDVKKVYGSLRFFLYDAAGDILGAVAVSLILLL